MYDVNMDVLNGNTVRLVGTFYDFADALVDPELLEMRIYDRGKTLISTTSLSAENKISLGMYEHFYKVDNTVTGSIAYFEYYAEIGGHSSVIKGQLNIII